MSNLSYSLAVSWPLYLLGALAASALSVLLHAAFGVLALWFWALAAAGLWRFVRNAPRPTPIQRATGRR
jgi:hypothetical protein